MSFRFSPRNAPARHVVRPRAPRIPNSHVLVTTPSSGGSPAIAFGSLHGRSGFAHPSSTDVAARLPSLYPKYRFVVGVDWKVKPAAGLNRPNAWSPVSDAGSSAGTMRSLLLMTVRSYRPENVRCQRSRIEIVS